MPVLEQETIHKFHLAECLPDIPALQNLFMNKAPNTGEGFDLFTHYPDEAPLMRVKHALEEAVGFATEAPFETARGWVKSLPPGEGIHFHAHDGDRRADVTVPFRPYPVGVFYLEGTSPIVFFRYHEEPLVVPVEPGMFLVFRNDFHHYVPPAAEFRQSLAVNFRSAG